MSARNSRTAKARRRTQRTVDKTFFRTTYEVEGMFLGWCVLLSGCSMRPPRRGRR